MPDAVERNSCEGAQAARKGQKQTPFGQVSLNAVGDVITILDADLTMPPELLPRFYEAYANGVADFINGDAPGLSDEGQAMRFLIGLRTSFSRKALSLLWTAGWEIHFAERSFSRAVDHEWMRCWNKDFGRFDPFGDYELLFSAAELGLVSWMSQYVIARGPMAARRSAAFVMGSCC